MLQCHGCNCIDCNAMVASCTAFTVMALITLSAMQWLQVDRAEWNCCRLHSLQSICCNCIVEQLATTNVPRIMQTSSCLLQRACTPVRSVTNAVEFLTFLSLLWMLPLAYKIWRHYCDIYLGRILLGSRTPPCIDG